jgi:hypothetical protein
LVTVAGDLALRQAVYHHENQQLRAGYGSGLRCCGITGQRCAKQHGAGYAQSK